MLILNPGGLLEPIESFIQLADLGTVYVEFIRLLDVNILLDVVIKKGGFDVYLLQVPIYSRRKRKDRLVIYGFYHRCESIMVVTTLLLFKTSNNPACLVAGDFPLGTSLHDVDLAPP